MKYLKSYSQFINESKILKNSKKLYEGGAFGHLMHPYEDLDLSVENILEITEMVINNSFTEDNCVREKTDGQNIMFTYKNGQVLAARNKGHLKNAGENALTISQISEMFEGRGEIQIAFVEAMRDFSNSLRFVDPKILDKTFQEGKRFISLEVITPRTTNVIPYGIDMLVFHSIQTYDDNGEVLNSDSKLSKELLSAIQDANSAAQERFFLRTTDTIEINIPKDSVKELEKFTKQLKKIFESVGLRGTDKTIGDYVRARGYEIVSKDLENLELSDEILEKLVDRILGISKTYKITNLKSILTVDDYGWYSKYEKTESKRITKEVYKELDSYFLSLGLYYLTNIKNFLVANPTEATEEIKRQISQTIKNIKSLGTEEQKEKLRLELERLESLGGIESIVPTEGIVFEYKGKLYKFTGLFAPINQILGIMRY